jgi:hypothetical protein
MRKLILVLLPLLFLSCETTGDYVSKFIENASETSSKFMNKHGIIVKNDPLTIINVNNYRDLPIQKKVKQAKADNLSDLVDQLIAGEDDVFKQVKNIHDWVALNISYDAQQYFSAEITKEQTSSEVFKTKLAVCEGYSNLFSQMCTYAGIKSTKISGYARGAGFSISGVEQINSNHAWNAVFLDDNWYLVDSTWDAGYLNGRHFEQEYETSYLFLEPENMIYTHYPEMKMWQLLEHPIEDSEFLDSPYLRGDYFQFVEHSDFENEKKTINSSKTASYTISLKDNYILMGTLSDLNGKKFTNRIYIKNKDEYKEIMISFPEKGKYVLKLFAAAEESNDYEYLSEFIFNSSIGSKITYPIIYGKFYEDNCQIIEPEDAYLLSNTRSTIKLHLPSYQEVFIDIKGETLYFKKESGDIFSLEIDIPAKAKALNIFGTKSKGSRNYDGLLSFQII